MSDNPIARALDDAGEGPEARGYAVPVDLVRRRAGRRRAWRTGGAAALALVVVGGATGGIASLGGWRDRAPDEGYTAAGDWPGQFTRCGEAYGSGVPGVLPDVGGWLDVRVSDAVASVPADGEWTATVTADLAGDYATPPQGWVWGTDLTLLRDGVVVGVQTGAQVPDAEGIDEWLGGTAPSFALEEFPIASEVSAGLASCESYLSPDGSPDLAPGSYDLVVTQTVSYLREDGTRTDLRDSTITTVTVTAGDGTAAPAEDAAACGAPESGLEALASPEANPYAFRIDAEVTGEALVGLPLPMVGSIAPEETAFLPDDWSVNAAFGVLTQGGVVVGDTRTAEGQAEPPAGAFGMFDGGPPQDCHADHPAGVVAPLPAGDYEVWVVLDLHLSGHEPPDVRVAGGPWPVTLLDHPTPATPPGASSAVDQAAEADLREFFPCGEPVGGDLLAVARGTSATLPSQWPLVLRADLPPAGPWEWSATLAPADDVAAVDVEAVGPPSLAFVDREGRTVGYATPSSSGPQRVTVGPEPLALTVSHGNLLGCGPDGVASAAYAEEGLPAGTYTAWPFVTVAVGEIRHADGFTVSALADPVLVVGPPRSVTWG